jgi:hypothetical protein
MSSIGPSLPSPIDQVRDAAKITPQAPAPALAGAQGAVTEATEAPVEAVASTGQQIRNMASQGLQSLTDIPGNTQALAQSAQDINRHEIIDNISSLTGSLFEGLQGVEHFASDLASKGIEGLAGLATQGVDALSSGLASLGIETPIHGIASQAIESVTGLANQGLHGIDDLANKGLEGIENSANEQLRTLHGGIIGNMVESTVRSGLNMVVSPISNAIKTAANTSTGHVQAVSPDIENGESTQATDLVPPAAPVDHNVFQSVMQTFDEARPTGL